MKRQLTAVVDTYPHTAALLADQVENPDVELQFKHYKSVRQAFAPMVRRREFDLSEMALATYVQARGSGSPITLLPVTMLARFQHPFVMKSARGPITDPRDLEGRRVGIRSYAQTTGVWVRAILSRQFGVDLSSIEWVAQEDTHVDGFERPGNVVFAPEGKEMAELLDSGDIAAAIVSYTLGGSADEVPMFGDLAAATQEWYRQTGILQINHMVCVGTDLVEDSPEVVRAILSMFRAARDGVEPQPAQPGPLAWTQDLDMVPFGTEAIRPVVETMLQLCIEQGLVGPELTIDDLLHPAIPDLEPASPAARLGIAPFLRQGRSARRT